MPPGRFSVISRSRSDSVEGGGGSSRNFRSLLFPIEIGGKY